MPREWTMVSALSGAGRGRLFHRKVSPASSLLLVFILLLIGLAGPLWAAPIQRVTGTITEIGEGYLLLRPEGDSMTRKFILRWKARFIPPKLPLQGDRVLILYKEKPEGAVIYGVNYLKAQPQGDPPRGGPSHQ